MVGAPAAADAVARATALPSLKVGLHVVLVDGTPVSRPADIPDLLGADGAFSTALALDHVNAHKHMHLHPTVARLIVEIGRDYGLAAMRLPYEPPAPVRASEPGARDPLGARLLRWWTGTLRRRLARARLATNDAVFGLAWTGAVTEPRVLGLLDHLPDGVSELYCHPAVARVPELIAAMPGYRPDEEFAALVSPAVRARVAARGIELIAFADLGRAA